MFDVQQEITVPIPGPEKKRVVVRFPDDGAISAWRKKKRVTQTDLGRRHYQIDPTKPDKADLDLFAACRVEEEGSPEVDESEAAYVVGRILECEIPERPEREGGLYRIHLTAMRKLRTLHEMGIPSMKQVMDYERQRSSIVFGQYGTQEIRINFRAAADLYDGLLKRIEGYAGRVPINHKAEVINVLLQELRAEHEEADEPEDDDDEG